MWRTSRQVRLLCPWARHLTGRLRLYVVDRWWGQAVYPSWWPSLTKDMQTEHELIRVNKISRPCADKYFCFLLSFEDFIILVQPFFWFTISLFENIECFLCDFYYFFAKTEDALAKLIFLMANKCLS